MAGARGGGNKRLTKGMIEARNRLDALLGRASYDKDFAKALRSDPRRALGEAGLLNKRKDIEAFVKARPADFDKIGDAMLRVLGPDFWTNANILASTCDDPTGRSTSFIPNRRTRR